ncbi:hypothetical protein Tco_0682688 [Tanacetum coccineum]|uniref:Reverse transcriptase domain-containing protein n=1 Tax=Tanacetum coccineum TaxID=301880 RepID=A0ABQ4XT96_9ASTR
MFYNALNANDQDSLNSAAGGIFLDKMHRECLRIIESKSKVRNSRNKAVVAKVSSNSSTPRISPDVAALTTEVSELKNMMKTMLIDKQKAQAPASIKAVEQSYVTCGDAHSYRNYPATDGNVYRDNIQEIRKTVQEPNSLEPDSYQPKLPYPKRMKVREKDKPSAQQSRFMKLFKQLRLEIGLKDALIEMLKFNKCLRALKPTRIDTELPNSSVYALQKDEPFSGSTTIHSDALPPSSSPVKTSDNLEEFADELTLLDSFPPGYFDSEGDVIFLENLLSDDTTHNLAPEVISDHESIHNTSITFSPRSDPLHHEFAGELITLPSRIVHDLIPPGVENDDSEDEDNSTFLPEHESPNLDHQDNLSSPRPPPEPPDVCFNIEPDTAMKNDEDFKPN